MGFKGQAEIALILGLVVIAVVVGLYSYSSTTPPSIDQVALTEEQKGVAVYVNDFLETSAAKSLSKIYKNGGYSDIGDAPLGSVNVAGFGDVAYWQMCGDYDIPDIVSNYKEEIRQYIMDNLPSSDSIGGRSVTFNKDAAIVDVTVYDNKVTVSATIPTMVDGTQVPQPYRVDVSTNIGRIADYAGNFARMEADCRMLDNNLLFSLMQSDEFSRDWLPFGSGNAHKSYIFTWNDLRERMEKYVKYSIAQTQIGRDIPINDEDQIVDFTYRGWDGSAMEFFFIPGVLDYSTSGDTDFRACHNETMPDNLQIKKYDDLKMVFYPGFDTLTEDTFSAPDTLEIKPRIGAFSVWLQPVGLKIAEYSGVYSVTYPVIVTLEDEKTHYAMRFATQVYIDNNAVGAVCSEGTQINPTSQSGSDYDENCLEDATEPANIWVEYDDGTPVKSAIIAYDGCVVGNTQDGVRITGKKVPSRFFSALTVAADENEYITCYNSDDLEDLTVTIPKSRNFRFHFYAVDISSDGNGGYTMSAPRALNDELVQVETSSLDADICGPRVKLLANIEDGVFVDTLDVDNLPIEDYNVSVRATHFTETDLTSGETVGFVQQDSFTPSGNDVYVYAPVLDNLEGVDVEDIKLLYERCNIDAVGSEYTGGSC